MRFRRACLAAVDDKAVALAAIGVKRVLAGTPLKVKRPGELGAAVAKEAEGRSRLLGAAGVAPGVHHEAVVGSNDGDDLGAGVEELIRALDVGGQVLLGATISERSGEADEYSLLAIEQVLHIHLRRAS